MIEKIDFTSKLKPQIISIYSEEILLQISLPGFFWNTIIMWSIVVVIALIINHKMSRFDEKHLDDQLQRNLEQEIDKINNESNDNYDHFET